MGSSLARPRLTSSTLRKAAAERAVACVAADDRANEAENDLTAGVTARTLAADQASESARLLSEAMAGLQASAARQPERDAAIAAVTQLEGVQKRVAGAEPLREAARSSSQAAVEAKAALELAVDDHDGAEQANARG